MFANEGDSQRNINILTLGRGSDTKRGGWEGGGSKTEKLKKSLRKISKKDSNLTSFSIHLKRTTSEIVPLSLFNDHDL